MMTPFSNNRVQESAERLKAKVNKTLEETTLLLHERTLLLQESLEKAYNDINAIKEINLDVVDPVARVEYLKKHNCVTDGHQDDDEYEDSEPLEVGDLKRLRKDTGFQQWLSSSHSNAILVRSFNDSDSISPDPWLSQAIAELAIKLQGEELPAIFHVVSNKDDLITIYGVIICEILSWDMKFYQEHRQSVEDTRQEFKNIQSSKDIQLLTQSLLAFWAKSHPHKPVYILLDRLDKFLPTRSSIFKQVIIGLIDVLRTAPNGIKLCFAMDDAYWDDIKDYIDAEMSFPGHRIFKHTKRLYQQTSALG
ncbi:hypothetical protein N7462_000195 [Penicillium macrosclerotiorum]|uniref:uncharacterized protein n=1 Tax=Penicillium macrosclerotiorum TaxID=303699 RepID=UPI0025489DB0|nr:uncharacterized protein N7462_000195 [Penicillium macrosclerotiorum]KAJ5698190.1 hypothetical protein N7462_000195 [Penicillium macrosclerotiorum]